MREKVVYEEDLRKNQFKQPIRYETSLNMAFYKIFSDYFNMLFQDKKLSKDTRQEID